MKRTITMGMITVMMMIPFAAGAQKAARPDYKGTHSFEIGAGANLYGILGIVGAESRQLGPGAYFEYRYAFANHFDVGGQINWKYGKGSSISTKTGEPRISYNDHLIAAKALLDYNICPTRLASPYMGIGVGGGYLLSKGSDGSTDNHPYGTVGWRIGVQIWHFRIAIENDFGLTKPNGFTAEETSVALNLAYTF